MGEAGGASNSNLHPPSAEAAVAAAAAAAAMAVAASSGRSVPGVDLTEWSNATGYGGVTHSSSSSAALGALNSQFADLNIRHHPMQPDGSCYPATSSSYVNQSLTNPDTSTFLTALMAAAAAAYHPMGPTATPTSNSIGVATGGLDCLSVHNQNTLLSNLHSMDNYMMNSMMYYGEAGGVPRSTQPPDLNNYMMLNHQPTGCWSSSGHFEGHGMMKTDSNSNPHYSSNNVCSTMYYMPPNSMRVSSSSFINHDSMLNNHQNIHNRNVVQPNIIPNYPNNNSNNNNSNNTNGSSPNTNYAVRLMMPSGPVSSTYSQMVPYDHNNMGNYTGQWTGCKNMDLVSFMFNLIMKK